MSSRLSSQRVRSPRAPRLSLRDAIRYSRAIYDAVHRSSVDSLTVYRLMGFAGKSGSSATALGSLRQFGLIEGIGEKTHVTELALRVLEPASEHERAEALAEAAHRPEVFDSIFSRFDQRIPPTDEPIRAFLIRDLGFSKTGAEDCIASFRETVLEVEDARSVVQAPLFTTASTDPREPAQPPNADRESGERSGAAGSGAAEILRLPLTRDCTAELRFSGKITERAIINLIGHVELMKGVWPED